MKSRALPVPFGVCGNSSLKYMNTIAMKANLRDHFTHHPSFVVKTIEAKLASLKVTEMLRKAKVPVYHSVSKDSLGAQLAIAEKLKVPYTIILGAREAIDGTVIVRNMSNRKQEVVKHRNAHKKNRTTVFIADSSNHGFRSPQNKTIPIFLKTI